MENVRRGSAKGYVLVIVAALLFGIAPTLHDIALEAGVASSAIMVINHTILFTIMMTTNAVTHTPLRVTGGQAAQLALLGLAMAITGTLLTLAYLYVPVGIATMIHFLYPTIVCLVMVLVFRQRMTWLKAAAVVVSIVGLLLLSGGMSAEAGSLPGILLAGASSITYASYAIISDRGSITKLPTSVCMAYAAVFSVTTNLIITLATGGSFPQTPKMWLLVLATGLMPSLGYTCLTVGIRTLGATRAAFLNMLEPVTSLLMTTLVTHYAIAPLSAVGCLLLIAAVALGAVPTREKNAGGKK